MNDKNIEKVDTYDKCVLCNCETQESTSKPIDFRNFYVEGVGQLCNNCFRETYNYERRN